MNLKLAINFNFFAFSSWITEKIFLETLLVITDLHFAAPGIMRGCF